MTKIYLDADACPVKAEVIRVAERHGLVVHMVSNGTIRPIASALIHRVLVPQGANAADDWIVARADEGDIAITADILLAARCLQNGAEALGPSGRRSDSNNIGHALALRGLKARLIDRGYIRGSTPSFENGIVPASCKRWRRWSANFGGVMCDGSATWASARITLARTQEGTGSVRFPDEPEIMFMLFVEFVSAGSIPHLDLPGFAPLLL